MFQRVTILILSAVLFITPPMTAQSRSGETVLVPTATVRAQTFDGSNTLVDLVFSLTYVDFTNLMYLNFASPQRSMVMEIEPSRYYPMAEALIAWSLSPESPSSRDYQTFDAIRVAWRNGSAVAGAITDVTIRFSRIGGSSVAVFILETPNAPFRTIMIDADRRLAVR